MYRDGIELRTEDRVSFVLSHCALGDGICSLPPIRWARSMHGPELDMQVWCPEHVHPLFSHLIGTPGLRFRPLHDLKDVLKRHKRGDEIKDEDAPGACVVNYSIKDTITRNKMDMVRFAYATMLDREPDSAEEMNYPSAPLGPRPPIIVPYVVLPVGATNDSTLFHPKTLNPLIEWLLTKGYLPVLTGSKDSKVHALEKGKPILLVVRDRADELDKALYDRCLDLRNKTTLMELRDLIGHSVAVAGVDGGTLHLAGTTDVPIVYGCTRVAARHRPIYRHSQENWRLKHVEPHDLECAGCQSNWTLMFKYNFANCAYGDHKCAELRAEDFINGLTELGL